MGVDLSLLPFDTRPGLGIEFSHSVLGCERRDELFKDVDAIQSQHGTDVPEGFSSYLSRGEEFSEPHYGTTLTTPYGDRLKSVEVEHLLKLTNHAGIMDNYKNRAIWSYLACLPLGTRIALYWH